MIASVIVHSSEGGDDQGEFKTVEDFSIIKRRLVKTKDGDDDM